MRSLDGLTWEEMTDLERLATLIPRLDARLAPSMSADPDLARRCREAHGITHLPADWDTRRGRIAYVTAAYAPLPSDRIGE
jgi:hypothetical protein